MDLFQEFLPMIQNYNNNQIEVNNNNDILPIYSTIPQDICDEMDNLPAENNENSPSTSIFNNINKGIGVIHNLTKTCFGGIFKNVLNVRQKEKDMNNTIDTLNKPQNVDVHNNVDSSKEMYTEKLADVFEYIAEDSLKHDLKCEGITSNTDNDTILLRSASESDILWSNADIINDKFSKSTTSLKYIDDKTISKHPNLMSQTSINNKSTLEISKKQVELDLSKPIYNPVYNSNSITEDIPNDDTEILNLDDFEDLFDMETEEQISCKPDEDIFNEDIENIIPMYTIGNTFAHSIKTDIVKDIETISISSTEDNEVNEKENIRPVGDKTYDSDDKDGYHSSDFEFITELEAKTDGYIINFNIENILNSQDKYQNTEKQKIRKNNDNQELAPTAGPSGLNRRNIPFLNRSYREHHTIPNEDGYLNLFRGLYNPLLPELDTFFMENKSTRTSAMNWRYDGIGFDRQLAAMRHEPDSSEDEFANEAEETINKILFAYPGENVRRRCSGRRRL